MPAPVISPTGFARRWAGRLENIGRRFCGSSDIFGACEAAIASRLAPTGDRLLIQNAVPCGSEPARDER
ncbi:hypothetical protein EJA72_25640 [Pseudomonas sp. PB120]|nr:hypothetical protein [Pseudomonas sp. PB120]